MRLAEYRQHLGEVGAGPAVREDLLEQLHRVPPVALLDGYWVTPVDLSVIAAGSESAIDREAECEDCMRRRRPLFGLAFSASSLRQALGLPFVGSFPELEARAATAVGVIVVPAIDLEEALVEYLPPRPEAGEESCYFFCGDAQTWDFDGDGEPNDVDPDDDGDGVADGRDAYPYWPGGSACDCGEHSFIGFTQKFSPAVTRAVLAAAEQLGGEPESVTLRADDAGVPDTRLVLSREALCAAAPPDCPDPESAGIRYVSRDPDDCARIRFRCDPGWVPFSDECGCGCRRIEAGDAAAP